MYPFTDEAKRAAVTPTELRVEEILSLLHTPSKADIKLITRGYEFAKGKHNGQVRYSGAPYFHHPFETAKYLAGIQMPASMIVVGLLHDVVEDAGVAPEEIRAHFGDDIAMLVESVTKLGTVRYRGMKRHVESLRKLFAATARDIRVMVVKLMDRLHNARTLHFVPEHKRERIALETLEIYAPIADRLGMGLVKRELEDGVFPHAYPAEYKKVSKIFNDAGGGDLKRLARIHRHMREKIAAHGLTQFHTACRVKGLYSLFRKLERKNWDITQIFDIWALRIIVPTAADCYAVLGVVHGIWPPLPGRTKDYLAFPKPNGYRSIHTTVLTGDGGVIELQIRTEAMHREAQLGIASHFAYKGQRGSVRGAHRHALSWIRQFIPARLWVEGMGNALSGSTPHHATESGAPEWIRYMVDAHEGDVNPHTFLNDIKADFFNHRIFVFTPRGDVIDLPIDSSPIDFAYAIHSDIGNHIAGAKVNGKMATLNTRLKNGDIVEIMTSDKAHPSGKWLRMAKTTLAKRHIRNYLQKSMSHAAPLSAARKKL